jgi:hypothetical protein
MRASLVAFLAFGSSLGCGTAAPVKLQAPSPPSVAAAPGREQPRRAETQTAAKSPDRAKSVQEPVRVTAVPTQCDATAEHCVPPAAFAEQVCLGRFPSLALAMFEKASPWERLYVKAVSLEPVNAYGGPRSDAPLEFGEQVLLLKHGRRQKLGEIQVSGPTDVDILRLDGTCATVREEMLVSYIPGELRGAAIVWRYLDAEFRDALLTNPEVSVAHGRHKKSCRGSSVNGPEAKCGAATDKLGQAVLLALHNGIELPEPVKRPRWSP